MSTTLVIVLAVLLALAGGFLAMRRKFVLAGAAGAGAALLAVVAIVDHFHG